MSKTPYSLTLTHDERRAIDWIGNRYSHGNRLFDLIMADSVDMPEEAIWNEPGDITFHMPERIAWGIKDIVESNDNLACFSDEFRSKLYDFVGGIV